MQSSVCLEARRTCCGVRAVQLHTPELKARAVVSVLSAAVRASSLFLWMSGLNDRLL